VKLKKDQHHGASRRLREYTAKTPRIHSGNIANTPRIHRGYIADPSKIHRNFTANTSRKHRVISFTTAHCLTKFRCFVGPGQWELLSADKSLGDRYVPSVKTAVRIILEIKQQFAPETPQALLDLAIANPADFQPKLLEQLKNEGYSADGMDWNENGVYGPQKVKVNLCSATNSFSAICIPKAEGFIREKFLSATKTICIDATHGTNEFGFQVFQIRCLTNTGYFPLCTFIMEKTKKHNLIDILRDWKTMVNINEEEVKYVVSDLALEEIGAVNEAVFPNAISKFCSFHVDQAVERQYKSLNSTSSELKSLMFRAVRDPTLKSFEELLALSASTDPNDPFNLYLTNNYLSPNARFPPDSWKRSSFVNLRYLAFICGTNNGVEGNWSAIKNRYARWLKKTNCSVATCFLKFMDNNWYETEQFYRKNIQMQSFQHRSADEYFTKFRPEQA